MNNYKIKLNNEAESKEAQELFFELGYKKGVCTSGEYPATIVAVVESLHCDTPFYSRALSLNHDAHKDYIGLTLPQLHDLVAQSKLKEQGLISGADALRALADGETVEVKRIHDNEWKPAQIFGVSVFTDSETTSFRLKPCTVKLEIEVPAPFEPKVGDIYFIVHPAFKSGYTCNTFVDTEKHKEFVKYGAWRTVEDIKIVVEQLRKIKEHSK